MANGVMSILLWPKKHFLHTTSRILDKISNHVAFSVYPSHIVFVTYLHSFT
jgi:hypothetical protein